MSKLIGVRCFAVKPSLFLSIPSSVLCSPPHTCTHFSLPLLSFPFPSPPLPSLSQSPLLRVVAAEGLAKLLLSGRVLSPKLVAKLLVLWYNPTMQEEDRLRAALGAFFPAFAASDRYDYKLLRGTNYIVSLSDKVGC